jgi:DNA-binding FadR family transcriptional regulator
MVQARIERSSKRGTVVTALRRQILEGILAPGSQLPSRDELVATFAVSPVTAQQAVECLKQDGFVYGRQGAGVFVVDHPPHLTNYALAFYENPHGGEYERFSRFNQALHAAAKGFEDDAARVVSAFYNCNGLCESPDYCRLT